MISFPFDRQKAIQVVLWLLGRHGGRLERMKLLKLLFFADRQHLVRHGRPICGGSYVAMQHGPVHSEVYDCIKSEQVPDAFISQGNIVVAKAICDEDFLSESDIETLNYANTTYGNKDSWHLRELTHQLEAWKRNYPDVTQNTSHALPFEDFFLDDGPAEMLDIMKEDQEIRDLLS